MNNACIEPITKSLLVPIAKNDCLREFDRSGEFRAPETERCATVHRTDHGDLAGLHDRHFSLRNHSKVNRLSVGADPLCAFGPKQKFFSGRKRLTFEAQPVRALRGKKANDSVLHESLKRSQIAAQTFLQATFEKFEILQNYE
jgi:hypothetical protein